MGIVPTNPAKMEIKMDNKLTNLLAALGPERCRVLGLGYASSGKAHKKARLTAARTGGAFTVVRDGPVFKVVEVISPPPLSPNAVWLGLDARGNIVSRQPAGA
jgi:hypothetical protein